MRMQVRRRPDGLTVVNDAYNANPSSMAAALKTLAALGRRGGRTVAVLGEMAELGRRRPTPTTASAGWPPAWASTGWSGWGSRAG